MIATNMGQLFPDRVSGLHLSFPAGATEFSSLSNAFSYFLGQLIPSTFYTELEIKHEVPKKYSFSNRLWTFWSSLGYLHLQVSEIIIK